MAWLSWAVPLVVVIFLWTLNEFLRGRFKDILSGVLALLIFGLCIVAFFVSGWIIGLVALIGSFVLGALFRYPAFQVAKKIVKYPDLGLSDYSQRKHQRIMDNLMSGDFDQLEQERHERSRHKAETVEKALNRPDVQAVLRKLSCSSPDIEAFYERVEISSLPPHLREIALCNANLLEYFLEHSVAEQTAGEHVRNVDDQNIAIRLTLWARHNPGGHEP